MKYDFLFFMYPHLYPQVRISWITIICYSKNIHHPGNRRDNGCPKASSRHALPAFPMPEGSHDREALRWKSMAMETLV